MSRTAVIRSTCMERSCTAIIRRTCMERSCKVLQQARTSYTVFLITFRTASPSNCRPSMASKDCNEMRSLNLQQIASQSTIAKLREASTQSTCLGMTRTGTSNTKLIAQGLTDIKIYLQSQTCHQAARTSLSCCMAAALAAPSGVCDG